MRRLLQRRSGQFSCLAQFWSMDDASDASDASDFCGIAGMRPARALVPVGMQLELAQPSASDAGAAAGEALAMAPTSTSPILPICETSCSGWAPLGVTGRSSMRTKHEHMLVCERMRAAKQKKNNGKTLNVVADAAEAAVRSSGRVLRRGVRLGPRMKGGKRMPARLSKWLGELSRKTNQKGARMTSLRQMEVAFDKAVRQRDVARSQGVCEKSVATTRQVTALECRRHLLAELSGWREEANRSKPLIAISVTKHDHARSKLRAKLDVIGNAASGRKQKRRVPACHELVPLEVLQSKRRLIMCWSDRTVEMPLPCPPIPVTSTNADCTYNALQLSEQSRPLVNGTNEILSNALFGFNLDASDGAYANKKYDAHMEAVSDLSRHTQACGNHAHALTETMLSNMVARGWRRQLYDLVGFVRTSTNFLRLLCVIKPLFQSSVKLMDGDCPATGVLLAHEIRQHMVQHFQEFSSAYQKAAGTRPPSKALEACKRRWDKFVTFFAGALAHVEACDDGVIQIYVGNGPTAASVDRDAVVMAATATFAETLMGSLPPKPEYGKWTLFCPAVDWFTIVQMVQMLMKRLVTMAYGHIPAVAVGAGQVFGELIFAQNRA